LPGFQSRHNSKYWIAAPYYGFGCSAHSYDGELRRWANERELIKYMELIEQGLPAVVSENLLTTADREAEAVFLGLRMMEGFSFEEYQRSFGSDLRTKHADDLRRFREAGLIECRDDLLKLTRAGALLSNEVFVAFM
jgi:oxygen-independent coproporphyrinogen-3 oxidase